MSVPTITPCPGGFITSLDLHDGRILVEGWALNLAPMASDDPCHEVAYHYIAATQAEAAKTVGEFAGWLDQPLNATA
ncbi:hypothetical protein [Streptomyces sp. NPDC020747]|uniref:hypothetical protein n=1 Tax=Streptomyces sp. NPDC020747 TaxID=3365086 RepID=UPI0037ABE451